MIYIIVTIHTEVIYAIHGILNLYVNKYIISSKNNIKVYLQTEGIKEMKGILKRCLCLLMVAAVGMAAASCGNGTVMKKIEKSGKLVIGTSADYAPYEYHMAIDGKDTVVGVDISIAGEISKDLGVQLEIVDMGFEELIAALNEDKVDIVISGISPDEEMKKAVDFSKIYYEAKQGVLVRSGDKDKLKSIADLKGKKVGAQSGTEQAKTVKEQLKDSEPVLMGKLHDLVQELKNKKIDALVLELPVANGYVNNNNDLAVSSIPLKDAARGFAIAVKKGNSGLVQLIDQSLDRIMKDGSVDKFIQEASDKNVTR